VSDTEKEEKQAMEKKLEEMEEKIKGLTLLDTVTDEVMSGCLNVWYGLFIGILADCDSAEGGQL